LRPVLARSRSPPPRPPAAGTEEAVCAHERRDLSSLRAGARASLRAFPANLYLAVRLTSRPGYTWCRAAVYWRRDGGGDPLNPTLASALSRQPEEDRLQGGSPGTRAGPATHPIWHHDSPAPRTPVRCCAERRRPGAGHRAVREIRLRPHLEPQMTSPGELRMRYPLRHNTRRTSSPQCRRSVAARPGAPCCR